jgi:hypothetical protein
MRVEVEVQGRVGGMVEPVGVEMVLTPMEMRLRVPPIQVVVVAGNVEIVEEILVVVVLG